MPGSTTTPALRVPIVSVRLGDELPEAERPRFEYLGSDSASFAEYVQVRANRNDPFYKVAAGGIDVCNVQVPIRRVPCDDHGPLRRAASRRCSSRRATHRSATCAIPPEAAEAIVAHEFERRLEMGKRRGFGSVKVTVPLGESRWRTSLFPNKDGSWFLPIKKPVRLCRRDRRGRRGRGGAGAALSPPARSRGGVGRRKR